MTDKKNKKIAFVCPYPYDRAPGQRFRFEQYYSLLKTNGYEILVLPFLDDSAYKILYKSGYVVRKVISILLGFLRRITHLFVILNCDFIFIYREATPLGYPVFEWILSNVFKKKIIYDFDDAIWLKAISSENKIISRLKFPQKVAMICRWSYKISAGNAYLQNFALRFNENSFINPTTIDLENYHNRIKNQKTETIVIGWTGSHSTLGYLNIIIPILKKLDAKYDFSFHVIADKKINIDLKKNVFTYWNKDNEISDLLNFNIGIMPLANDEWSQGKCGFKALQYMSLGIPAVVSSVGVNSEIVSEGIDGFCCDTEDEWFQKLSLLIEDMEMRVKMGDAAVKKVSNKYSLQSNSQNFLDLFK